MARIDTPGAECTGHCHEGVEHCFHIADKALDDRTHLRLVSKKQCIAIIGFATVAECLMQEPQGLALTTAIAQLLGLFCTEVAQSELEKFPGLQLFANLPLAIVTRSTEVGDTGAPGIRCIVRSSRQAEAVAVA